MKRLNNLYDKIISIDNLILADEIARKGKAKQRGVNAFDVNREQNIADLYRELVNKNYKTSAYRVMTIKEKKERIISILPYRDRIIHHAIMNVLEPMFVKTFTKDTYSCIKGKGIHSALKAVVKSLKDVPGTRYCLKIDIRKFYPSVNHEILKQLLRKKIKDKEVLWLLDGIIDSAEGLPIGNYLSQYFANFYLSYFDHWIKEVKGVKHYFRYADDIVIFSDSKPYLHSLLTNIRSYLHLNLKLDVKGNYQVFPVNKRGVDFLGYVIFHTHILIRKSIKQSFARKVARGITLASFASYMGWAKHANAIHLVKKLSSHEANKIIQRTRNRIRKPVVRKKNWYKPYFKQRNIDQGLSGRSFKVSDRREWKTPNTSN